MELIEAVTDYLETEHPGMPYAYKTRVNLVGKELVEFQVNNKGAVRYFVAPHPEYDENIIKTFIRQMKREIR